MGITIPVIELSTVAPEIILSCVAILVLMIQFLKSPKVRLLYPYISLTGIVAAGLLIFFNFGNLEITGFGGSWIDDRFARMFKLIFLLGTGMTVLLSVRYAREAIREQSEYYFLLLFATVGMMTMSGGADMITIFLGLELLSISLYVLAGIIRTRTRSIEASIKYFILGSFAAGFLLYGMALIFGATGTTNLSEINRIIQNEGEPGIGLFFGLIFLVVGFGFKIAVVPFHMWTPDVYEGAPAPVTAFMSVGPKAAALAAFSRILVEALQTFHSNWVPLIWILSALTMTIGNLAALRQSSVKRMLAYSSIAHVGYVLVGLVSNNQEGVSAVSFYFLVYAFMNMGAFGVLILIAGKAEERTRYEDYTGLFQTHPKLAITMALFMVSLAGIPPTAGFMGKFYLFSAAIKADCLWLAIIGVLNSVVSVYYYLRVTIMMFMKTQGEEQTSIVFSPSMIFLLLISVYGVIRLGIAPADFIRMAKVALLFP